MMTPVPDWPVLPLFVFLTAVAFGRGGGTYLIARGARGVADRGQRLEGWRAIRRGEQVVRRYGAPAVTLCFLTIGIQTAVNAAAGSLRMPLRRYLPALLLGALVWAAIYLTLGLAVLEAFWGERRVWLLLLVAAGAAALVLGVRRLLDRRVTSRGSDPDGG